MPSLKPLLGTQLVSKQDPRQLARRNKQNGLTQMRYLRGKRIPRQGCDPYPDIKMRACDRI